MIIPASKACIFKHKRNVTEREDYYWRELETQGSTKEEREAERGNVRQMSEENGEGLRGNL